MSKKDDVNKWLKRISNARDARDEEKNNRSWTRFLDYYEGKYNISPLDQHMKIIPANYVFGYVHTELARLYFRDPHIAVNPKSMAYIQRAKLAEVALNYLVTELSLKNQITKALIDTFLIGHGWLKYGYSAALGHMETASDVSKTGRRRSKDQPVEEVNDFIKSEEVFVTYVPWEDVVFDVMAKDPPYDCRWVAHRLVKPLEAVKASDMYEGTSSLHSNYTPKDYRGDVDLVEMWEVWDKDSNSLMVVAQGHETFLRDGPNPYQMEGLPFSMLKFNVINNKPYPLSDIGIIEPQFIEKIKLRSMQLNHLKRWNRQVFIEKNAMSQEELAKYSLGIDGAVIQPEPGTIAGNKFFLPSYPPMQMEMFQVDNLIQQDLDGIIGQTQVERGSPAQTRTRTLGEVEMLRAGSLTRANKRQDVLEDFLEEVCKKLLQLFKQFQLIPRYARAIDQDITELQQVLPQSHFDGVGVMFTGEDIQGEYDVEVKVGSTIPLNKENRLRVSEQILKLGPAIGVTPGGPVSRTIGREILRDLDFKEVERAFAEEEAALQQQAQMQQQLLQAQMAQGQPTGGEQPLPGPMTSEPVALPVGGMNGVGGQ